MNLSDLLKNEIPNGGFWNKAWSLIEGCMPVSPGCAHCWLAGMYRRELPNLTKGLIDPQTKHFNGTVAIGWDRLDIPLKRKKPTVYAVWSDLFHESVPPEFIGTALSVMALSARHRFIVVTKRPQRAADYLAGPKTMWQNILSNHAFKRYGEEASCQVHNAIECCLGSGRNVAWPLSNIIILVTMEDKERFNQRAPYAMKLAAMGWKVGILAEPLLGGFDPCFDTWPVLPQWLITGGESGSGARPAHPDWFRMFRDQAQTAKVPFLFKQWGEFAPSRHEVVEGCVNRTGGRYWYELDPQCNGRMRRLGKKAAGRVLDGRTWDEVPKL